MSSRASSSIPLLADYEALVRASYAHNSRLYVLLAESATLQQITSFLTWDSRQPPFNVFLRRWLTRVPPCSRDALRAHIKEEEDERHFGLFREMMDSLCNLSEPELPNDTSDLRRLDELNAVFSENCAGKESPGFFFGVFLATEIMSQKRCAQILEGLGRLRVEENLDYLELHAKADTRHVAEVRDRMVAPAVLTGEVLLADVEAGIRQRLTSSEDYIRWYESRFF